ncbi:MAG: hypothetical protein Tsb002_38220 [Wenzhouxiangellaceae bacterium]
MKETVQRLTAVVFTMFATAAQASNSGGTGNPQRTADEWAPVLDWLIKWWPF